MEIPPMHRSVDPSRLQPEELASNQNISEKQKITELCRQFEAVLLRQILKDAQKTVIKSDLTTESVSGDIYQDMITTQLAESISLSGSLGFAQSLEKELARQVMRTTEETSENK